MVGSYFETESGISLLAHRGLALPGSGVVENTLSAFAAALGAGATHIETDVQATRDGVAVLFHDDDLGRIFNDPRKVSQVSFAELGTLSERSGVELLPLTEALAQFPQAKFNLDVKSWSAVDPTVEALEYARAHERVLVSSFSDARRLLVLRGLSRPVATSAGSASVMRARFASAMRQPKLMRSSLFAVDALQIPQSMYGVRFASKSFVSNLRNLGLHVHFWTINDLTTAQHLIDLGATGLVSDRVDLISPLLGKH